jgi:methanogenic corrinoid protein MtbC1
VGTPGVPIAEVAQQLGVPITTLRSWELRYNLPERVRTAGTHRRYSARELHALRLMRDEIARGTRASLAAQSVLTLLGGSGPAAEYVEQILAASARFDPVAVRDQLSRANAALGLTACLDDVLLPAMKQIGLWWETGRCDVEQEHFTTEVVRAWMESLVAYAPDPVSRIPIVLACGPTDQHTIGLEALATLLRYRRWSCRSLGARTSVAALTTASQATGARAVVVVSHLSTGRKRAVESMHATTELGAAVFYAGNAFPPPRRRRNVPGTYLGSRLEDAGDLIDSALTSRLEPIGDR